MENRSDWPELLPEIVHLISKKLPGLFDFIRFRSVCNPWRSFAPASDPPLQFPWIWQSYGNCLVHGPKTENVSFYSMSAGKTYIYHSSSLRDKCLTGCFGGYMLAAPDFHDRQSFSLINPITNDHIHLPCVNEACPQVHWSNPLKSRGGYVVVSDLLDPNNPKIGKVLAFYRPGDENWVYIRQDYTEPNKNHNIIGCAIYMGKYLRIENGTGITKAIDIATQTLAYDIPPIELLDYTRYDYLVESCEGILRVIKCLCNDKTREFSFEIYKLDARNANDHKPRWIKINDIGRQILFLDKNKGFSLLANCDISSNSKGNRIYYFDYYIYNDKHLYRYDIEDRTNEELYCSFKNNCVWFVPGLE